MKAFQLLTASFCLACICAETVTLLAGSGWTRRCIKALAGLYILVVLLGMLADAGTQLKPGTAPEYSPVSIRNTEELILAQAEVQLEEQLEAECRARFGKEVRLEIRLEQHGQAVSVSDAEMILPQGDSREALTEPAEYLRQELGHEVKIVTEEERRNE